MKLFLTFLLILPLATYASVPVNKYQVGPFSCREAEEVAKMMLEQKCESMNLKLEFFYTKNCTSAGSDGGYVDYFGLEAYGVCQ